MSTLLTISNMI